MTEFYWHVHHGILLESLTEPIENRIAYIKAYKPEHERELRLRLLRPVRSKLPDGIVEAREAYDRAWEAYVRAREAYDRAWEAYVRAGEAYDRAGEAYSRALADHREEIEALHAEECPNCPWDGETIFPEPTP